MPSLAVRVSNANPCGTRFLRLPWRMIRTFAIDDYGALPHYVAGNPIITDDVVLEMRPHQESLEVIERELRRRARVSMP